MALYFLRSGDLFTAAERADAVVIPVNTVGGAGAGVAAQARITWPANFYAYREWCRKDLPMPGNIYVYERITAPGAKPRYLINAATKAHWRMPSEIAWVRRTLKRVRSWAEGREEVGTIVIPALGCGLGKLAWADVQPVMIEILENVRFAAIVFEPQPSSLRKDDHADDHASR